MNYEEQIKAKEQELFQMVYDWGRVGLVVQSYAPAFQKTLQEYYELRIKRDKGNEENK